MMLQQKYKEVNLELQFLYCADAWTNDANVLSAQVLNRHQDNLDLLFIDGTTATSKIVLNENKAC
jgi:dipeptidyl-peptidase-4